MMAGNQNYGEVPMEGQFSLKPDLAPKIKEAMASYYTDKQEPVDVAPDTVGPNRKIPKAFEPEPVMYDPYCNYLGYEGGARTLISWDEYKITNNTVKSVPVEYAEDCQSIDGMNGSERI
jgi:hypothetical protein